MPLPRAKWTGKHRTVEALYKRFAPDNAKAYLASRAAVMTNTNAEWDRAVAKAVQDYERRYGKGTPKTRASRKSERSAPSRSSGNCPSGYELLEFRGRVVCLDRQVQAWLTTGNGSGSEETRGGTPASAKRDLEKALGRHFEIERKNAGTRFISESKFETSSRLVHDDYGQGLWLWLNTHKNQRGSRFPEGSISVSVDHG